MKFYQLFKDEVVTFSKRSSSWGANKMLYSLDNLHVEQRAAINKVIHRRFCVTS